LRGSGRFSGGTTSTPDPAPCLNPLHCGAVVASGWRARRRSRWRRFNPLHCGAVVASSLWGREPFRASVRLNPLHCGAVVASHQANRRRFADCRGVSIPFIAGQWSLRLAEGAWPGRVVFQSPSLRGSGRFMGALKDPTRSEDLFQSPSLRGSGRFMDDNKRSPDLPVFQSPSLRGSGRFRRRRCARFAATSCFNPLHCGAVVASPARLRPDKGVA